MTPWSEETKLLVLGLTVAVVMSASAFIVTKLLSAGAAEKTAAVEAATLVAQKAADAQTATWAARASAAEASQGNEHAAIDALRSGLSALRLPVSAPAARLPASPAAPVSGAAAAAAQLRQVVVCEASDDLRSDYGDALKADAIAADMRVLFESWPTVAPPQ